MSVSRSSGSGIDDAIMHTEFMAFVGDEASSAVIRAFAERQGFPAAAVQTGGPEMFAQMLEQTPAPKLAIIDIDGQDDPVLTATRLVGLCGNDCKLIAIGSANDISLYRRIVAAGMADYLVKPLNLEALAQAYAAVLRGTGKGGAKDARIIVMIGVRGGVGASTIAVNTGWLLAHELKSRSVMLDLDLQFGTTALALDLEPGRGLRDVVNSPQRVDGLMVASSIVAESDMFSVLSAEESIDEAILVDSVAITALLRELKHNFDFIVVDLPRQMLAGQKRLLAAAHEIVLVTELSLAGIRDTLRIKNALDAIGSTAHISLAVARTSTAHPGQVDQAAFEKGAQIKVDFTIPEDSKTVAQAANTGKALGAVAPEAAATKALLALATKLSGKTIEATESKKSLWGSILGSPSPAKPKKDKAAKPDDGAAQEKK
jgi:pilus assembly protein CpaE